MNNVLVSGSLAYDHIMDFPGLFKDHFIADKLHNINVSFNIESYAENFGGTAGNVAYSLHLLGVESRILSTVGNDFARYRDYLTKLGINTDAVHVNKDTVTAAAYIMTDQGDNQIAAFHAGALATSYGANVPIQDGKLAIISAGCIDDMRMLPDVYRGNGITYLFDPGQAISALSAHDLRGGITDAHTVFTNDYEFAMMSIKTGWKEEDVVKAAQVLVITLGERGSRVITKEGETAIGAVRATELRDPTGAGDAYRAGYIKGLMLNLPIPECAQLGSTVAAYAVESYGTQSHHFTPVEIQERYQAAYGKPIALQAPATS